MLTDERIPGMVLPAPHYGLALWEVECIVPRGRGAKKNRRGLFVVLARNNAEALELAQRFAARSALEISGCSWSAARAEGPVVFRREELR